MGFPDRVTSIMKTRGVVATDRFHVWHRHGILVEGIDILSTKSSFSLKKKYATVEEFGVSVLPNERDKANDTDR